MREIIDAYLTVFMHPFRIYDYYWFGIPLPGRELNPIKRLTLTESLSFSWLIAITRAFFDLMLLNFAANVVGQYFVDNDDFFTVLGINTSFAGYYFFLIKMVVETLLFPLFTFVWVLFWEFLLKHLGNFLGVENAEEKSHLIVSNSLTSNLIRIVPIFGDMAQGLMATLHLYAGVKKSFELDSRAAALAISMPFLLVAFFITFLVVCLTFFLI